MEGLLQCPHWLNVCFVDYDKDGDGVLEEEGGVLGRREEEGGDEDGGFRHDPVEGSKEAV